MVVKCALHFAIDNTELFGSYCIGGTNPYIYVGLVHLTAIKPGTLSYASAAKGKMCFIKGCPAHPSFFFKKTEWVEGSHHHPTVGEMSEGLLRTVSSPNIFLLNKCKLQI